MRSFGLINKDQAKYLFFTNTGCWCKNAAQRSANCNFEPIFMQMLQIGKPQSVKQIKTKIAKPLGIVEYREFINEILSPWYKFCITQKFKYQIIQLRLTIIE
jgi:hypothetical protein